VLPLQGACIQQRPKDSAHAPFTQSGAPAGHRASSMQDREEQWPEAQVRTAGQSASFAQGFVSQR
jgi:hypothetical protein